MYTEHTTSLYGDKRMGMGTGDENKGKDTFHEPVMMIHLRPKTKEKMWKNFFTWGEEVAEYIRQKE